MTRVFISSPYTKGSIGENLNRHFQAANALIDLGFNPYVPLFNHFLEIMQPRPYQVWLDMDFEWVEHCDVVLRLPGESAGADRECEHAAKTGIPVYFSIKRLVSTFRDIPEMYEEPLRNLIQKALDGKLEF